MAKIGEVIYVFVMPTPFEVWIISAVPIVNGVPEEGETIIYQTEEYKKRKRLWQRLKR